MAGRTPLLRCIAKTAGSGQLDRAHRCYRALRLIESARWWLRTLNAEDTTLPPLYRGPVETMRSEFLCRIERLAAARTPATVQARYLEMIQAFP